MALSVGKLAPSAVVLAFVGYCAWPSLSDMMFPPPPPAPPEKVPELAAALFSPAIPPVPTRNPWGGLDAAALATAGESAAQQAEAPSDDLVDSAIAQSVAQPVDPFSMLRLEATSILGDQRMAVINGQLCMADETVTVEETPYRIVRVLPDKVLLKHGGKIVDLVFSNIDHDAAPPPDDMHANSLAGNGLLAEKPPDDSGESTPATPAVLGSLLKQSGGLGSLLNKQAGVLGRLLKSRSATSVGTVADEIDPSNKAGD